MFKFKNFKILLLLMLFAFAGKDAWAGDGNWMYMHIQVDSYPAAGKVYASSSQSSAQNTNNCVNSPYIDDVSTAEKYINQGKTLWYVNTIPTDASKWAFVGWVKDAANDFTDFYNTTYVSTDRNPTSGFADPGTYASSTADGHGPPIDHSQKPYYYPDPFPITLRMTAVYRSIKPDVIAVTNNGELGTTDFTDANNSVGETVVLSATPSHYNSKFEGWYKDGVCVSKSNPLSFEITEGNKGTYTAMFVEHKFMRIKNSSTNRYINGVNDVGSITNFSSLLLEGDRDATKYLAGTVIYLWDYERTNPTAHPYVFDIQGFSSSSYYDDTRGIYVTILHNNIENTWTISDKDKSYYMTDKGTESVEMAAINAGFPLGWVFEHIDNDLETCENYFSLDPNKLVEVDGKYYTTLRTSWNILFNPEQMTPYIVKSVDETEGTFEMEPITGNIIPLNTPVIIETKSTDIEENRMVPTLTNAASGAVPSGNLLQHSEKYFPNQNAPVSNCKGLYKNANGQLAFGGNALNTVNGNEAYLSVANEVVKIETLPLSEIEQVGVKNRKYIVEDLLIAVAYAEDTEGSSFLWCKDQGDKSIFATTIHDGKQIDFLLNDENAQNGLPWDQSNWVALKFTGLTTNEADVIRGYVNSYINEKAITGELVDDNNYMLNISAKTLATTAGASYSKNVYCTSNFVLGNLNIFGSIENGDGGYTSGNSAQNYFFMNPKVQEVCKIIYARWDAENNCFTVPITSGFAGNVSVNLAYNEIPNLDLSTALTDKKIYQFEAIVNRASKSAYEAKANRAGEFIVYPLNLTGGNENDPPTAISIVSVNREVVDVEYVNCMGVVSKHPFSGVNIVVTRYSDGSRTTVKMMK